MHTKTSLLVHYPPRPLLASQGLGCLAEDKQHKCRGDPAWRLHEVRGQPLARNLQMTMTMIHLIRMTGKCT